MVVLVVLVASSAVNMAALNVVVVEDEVAPTVVEWTLLVSACDNHLQCPLVDIISLIRHLVPLVQTY